MTKKITNFAPDPEQMALWPEISGNEINGLGEEEFRRPTYVYWTDPETIPHGSVQKWFYSKNTAPELIATREERAVEQAIPLSDLTKSKVKKPAEEWARIVKDKALHLGAEAVGIADIKPEWMYEGKLAEFSHIIILAIQMTYDEMTAAPEPSAGAEVVRQYTRGMKTSKRLASWIRKQGYDAKPEHGPLAGDLTLVPAALQAGMGELGKHGSIINRELGSCFRLAAVLTSLPLVEDSPDKFGADDFCASCRVCSNHCPPDAISPEKQKVRGQDKWYVDFDKCLPFFNETAGCGICVTVCPFSRPGVGQNLIAKLARRTKAHEN
jgi:epoxyqueuosine reductase